LSRIEYNVYGEDRDPKFTILIPTWNNLEYLKLCVKSIRERSAFPHQIILHVNDGSDGTREWAKEQRLDHTGTPENIGICYAMNAASSLARTDYVVFLNDDMFVCPQWDAVLWKEIEAVGHDYFFFSSTLIEPTASGNQAVIVTDRFGDRLENFKEDLLAEEGPHLEKDDWQGATWAPNIVHLNLWKLVGGYSIEFSPGMYSDPDFSKRLWEAGVRLFKGVGASRVFHFQCRTIGKAVKNDGRRQFREKWNLSSSDFTKHYLRLGRPFTGPCTEPEDTLRIKWARLRGRLPF